MKNAQQGFSLLIAPIILIAIMSIAFAGWHVSKNLQLKKNDIYFSNLATNSQNYYTGQAKALGVESTGQDIAKVCFRVAQGAFNNGRLFCGIRSERKIAVPPDPQQVRMLLGLLGKVAKSQGFHINEDGTKFGSDGSTSFDAGNLECSSRALYYPIRTEQDAKTTLTWKLECDSGALRVPPDFHCQKAGDASKNCAGSL